MCACTVLNFTPVIPRKQEICYTLPVSLEEDVIRLHEHEVDHFEHLEALIEEMRDKYHEEMAQGPPTFEPNPALRYILMELVHFDQRRRMRPKDIDD